MTTSLSVQRMYGVVLRYWFDLIRSYDRMVDTFYWVALDMVLWSITGVYVSTISPDHGQILFSLLASVILWNVTYRAQADISICLLGEIWVKNLINLFSSPVTFLEWIVALLFLGFLKSTIMVAFGGLIASIFYGFNVFSFTWHLPLFFFLLLMSGWWLGFLVAALVFRLTSRVQALAWTFVWLLAPFSAIFMPLSSLPSWVQMVAWWVPMSHVFEAMRAVLFGQAVDYNSLLIAFVENLVLLGVSAIILYRAFISTLNRGLVKLL